MAAPRVALLSPVPLDSPRGNAVTVARIAGGLRARGLDVGVWEADAPGLRDSLVAEPPELIHAFHAHRTGPLALAIARAAAIPLVVTLTGTDVSHDLWEEASRAAVLDTPSGVSSSVRTKRLKA